MDAGRVVPLLESPLARELAERVLVVGERFGPFFAPFEGATLAKQIVHRGGGRRRCRNLDGRRSGERPTRRDQEHSQR